MRGAQVQQRPPPGRSPESVGGPGSDHRRPSLAWHAPASWGMICRPLRGITRTVGVLVAIAMAGSTLLTANAAFDETAIPVGRICAWQSLQRLVGCGIGVTAPPGVRLQGATAVSGPWTDVTGTSPFTIPATGPQRIFRGITP